jgi:hypothetical protein
MITRKLRNQFTGLIIAVILLLGGVRQTTSADEQRDPKAVEVERAMVQAMGGEDAWNATHFVRFDFKLNAGGTLKQDNAHLWDRKDGRYRIERRLKGGKHEVDLFNIADYERDKSGAVYVDGKKLEGDQARKLLEGAYRSYINDTWWLCMPWKWMATGANLKYIGTKARGRETFDVVEITFGHVGLTPGDMYHAFVSQKSHLMTHWEYTLSPQSPVPVKQDSWDWEYGDFNGVKLATNHIDPKKVTINMGDVRVLDQVDNGFFTDPSHPLSRLK